MSGKKVDLTGQKFGLLTIIGVDRLDDRRVICQCECGTVKSILRGALVSGSVRSCGCATAKLRAESRLKAAYEKNKNMTGQKYGKLTVIGPDPTSHNRVICMCECGEIRPVNKYALKGGRIHSCGCSRHEHKPISSDCPNKVFRTHVGLLERTAPNKNNITGFRGVHYDRSSGKYKASLMYGGVNHYLGCFSNVIDAIKARKKGEQEIFAPVIEAKNAYLAERKAKKNEAHS